MWPVWQCKQNRKARDSSSSYLAGLQNGQEGEGSWSSDIHDSIGCFQANGPREGDRFRIVAGTNPDGVASTGVLVGFPHRAKRSSRRAVVAASAAGAIDVPQAGRQA